jgi:excisionase family DNA binding protein
VDKQLLNIREFAEVVGIGETLAKRLIHDGTVLSVHIGDRRLVPAKAVETYVQRLIDDAEAGRDGAGSND